MNVRGFSKTSRLLHWLMATLIIAMLFIGVGMVGSVTDRYRILLAIHRPLGIAILILAAVRVANRLLHPPPPLPAAMPSFEKLAARASHIALYALMFIMPLVGWAMLSAAPYPITLFGTLRLPPILGQDPALYSQLRALHTSLAFVFYAVILVHLGAALMHAWIRRDGVFESMASGSEQPDPDRAPKP
jgi:cytochrome b561